VSFDLDVMQHHADDRFYSGIQMWFMSYVIIHIMLNIIRRCWK